MKEDDIVDSLGCDKGIIADVEREEDPGPSHNTFKALDLAVTWMERRRMLHNSASPN